MRRNYQPTAIVAMPEAAKRLGISERTLRRLCGPDSVLDKRRIGGTRRVGITEESLLQFMGEECRSVYTTRQIKTKNPRLKIAAG